MHLSFIFFKGQSRLVLSIGYCDLPFEVCFFDGLDGLDGIQETAVVCSSILRLDLGWFCVDKPFPFKALNIFFHCVFAHAGRTSYRTVAWMTLKCLSIFAVHKIGIDYYFTCRQVKIEDGFRQRKVIAGVISFLGIVVKQTCTSCGSLICFLS